MTKKARIKGILAALDARYPFEDKCYLNYSAPHELLIATILSAQCTDERVNIVTAELFAKYPSLEAFAQATLPEMEAAVRSTGFYRNKAKNIIAAAGQLLSEFGGEMPSKIEDLTRLPGVGRKTANVVRNHIFQIPAVVVDTHVKRISAHLGLTKNSDPVKIEFDLMDALPQSHWIRYNHQIIAFGREICKAPRPKCQDCFMPELCVTKGAAPAL
ncbi:MAG: endonuclease III [Clostridiales bacterium]|jgi:endonuclease-3|nr:endonuclease III [Clostridiales bacterium]